MNNRELNAYLDATRDVEGWFFPIDAALFALIDEAQKRKGIRGDLFEIGVHHGKTAIFLARMAGVGESLRVCDVFEQQELNRDRSGEGSRALFERNLRAHSGIEAKNLHVFAKLSSALTDEDTTTRCRFFHIDGGHRAEDVVSDLHTASRALLPDGVVALDDLFNPSWPGVSEGFHRFVADNPHVFAPIFIGGNKVFFTRPAAVERYERHLSDAVLIDLPAFTFERKEWLGGTVLTAIRKAWVDLDPIGAARLHLPRRSWKDRIRRFLLV